jgi:hypothetical protein
MAEAILHSAFPDLPGWTRGQDTNVYKKLQETEP